MTATRAERLTGVPERRSIAASQFEFRAAKDTGALTLTGHASVFDSPYDVYGGPDAGGWTEQVDRKAFNNTLRGNPDVHLLINHEGMPLARTKSQTMRLSTDKTGLYVEADLDRADPDVQRLETKMRRGDMDEMSFAFYVLRQEWNEDETDRRLTEVSIHRGDVSVVNFGANPATSTTVRSLVSALAGADPDRVLAEARGVSQADLAAAHRALGQLVRSTGRPTAKTTLSLAEARALAGDL